ncbi:collagen-binding domain-containing protein [Actomonas aquatica]|uniref:Collagen-binding domain-containing protein n=1 Tax=Actomonas aquatica TaxID=2866162 RepID=A0ABZ1CAE8_9BACT|nr:collagen-binding domain-containing protein [Opitutus sp. WL0086]WRQ88662.1 collagen-binding domain-containing protein [Opitutus sp. WL0086]
MNRLSFRSCFSAACLLVVGVWGTSALHAQVAVNNAVYAYDQAMRNYGLITFGDTTLSNYGDTWGPLAVGGNLTLNGSGSIAQKPELFGVTSDPTLYVAGQLNLTGDTQLHSGYASTPNLTGNWSYTSNQRRLQSPGNGRLYSANSSDPQAAFDPRTNPTPANWDFANLENGLVAISQTLAAATPTGSISLQGQTLNFNANGATSGVVVFNLDMNLFNGVLFDANGNGSWDQNQERVSQVKIDVPTDVTYVINVLNATDKTIFGGINFNSGTNNEQLLWNITPDSNGSLADSVSLGGGARFYGSILAPEINLSNSGNVAPEGQIVASSYTHNGAELHFKPFDSTVGFTPVPEPRTWGLITVALAGAMIWHQRRRQKRTA